MKRNTRRNTGFEQEAMEVIFARSYGSCEIMIDRLCEIQARTIHHRRPRGMGGTRRETTNYASNGLAACNVCHEIVEGRREWSLANGFLVRQEDDPATVPVWWRCAQTQVNGRWLKKMVVLDHGGKMREVGE